MLLRSLLISSLIAQLAFAYPCCTLLIVLPSITCPGADDSSVALGWPVQAERHVPRTCSSEGRAACGSGPSPCSKAPHSRCGGTDDAPKEPCDDGNCNTRPTILPQKVPGEKVVKLVPPALHAWLDLACLRLSPKSLPASITPPRRWMPHQTRQAWLGIWRN